MNVILYSMIRGGIVLFWLIIMIGILRLPDIITYFVQSDKKIAILAWPTSFSSDYVKDFEKKTGVKVYVTYLENNEELFLKMKSGGASGYDLIVPSDYIVKPLIQEGLIKKIDINKLDFYNKIYSNLLHHPFDLSNQYTIPYIWNIYGLLIDADNFLINNKNLGWDLVFSDRYTLSIGIINDAKELVSLAGFYLFHKVADFNDQEWTVIKETLLKQKQRVAMYTDLRADYLLLTKICSVGITNTVDAGKSMETYSNLKFILPQEGSFWVIDSFAIAAETKKEEYIYQFLNYLYSAEVMEKYAKNFGFAPAIKIEGVSFEATIFSEPYDDLVKKLFFFDPSLSSEKINDIWFSIKT